MARYGPLEISVCSISNAQSSPEASFKSPTVFKAASGCIKKVFTRDKSLIEPTHQDKMDTDTPNGSAEPKPKTRKIKKQVRKGELPLSAGTPSLDQPSKDAFAEKENLMYMEDKLVSDTEDKKNELESYIYELRGKIDDQYADFASEEEKTKLKEKLEQSEACQPTP